MSAAPEMARALPPPAAPAPPPARAGRAGSPPIARRLAAQIRVVWLPRVAWSVHRTGRVGLLGIALLLASALFFFTTHLRVVGEVEAMRAELAAAEGKLHTVAREPVGERAPTARALPARAELPAILRQLFNKATQAKLAVDTGKYEVKVSQGSSVVRYHVAFPVSGPYPQIRAFLDNTLLTMPAVALTELSLERKTIGDGEVEAQIEMTVYTAPAGAEAPGARSAPAGAGPALPASVPPVGRGAEAARAAGSGPEAKASSDRVVAPSHASALFAQHTWTVLAPQPVPPPAPPPPPPPPPTAPPFPYTFVGSFAPGSDPPVFFLSRGDRVFNVRIGDVLEGVYQLESAAAGQLVFVYLPLNIRQNIQAGASK